MSEPTVGEIFIPYKTYKEYAFEAADIFDWVFGIKFKM